MKCSIKGCPGEYESRVITHTVRRGGHVVVIDHVPAEVAPDEKGNKKLCGWKFARRSLRPVDHARSAAQSASRTGSHRGSLLPARPVSQRPSPRRIPLRPLRKNHRPAGRRRQTEAEAAITPRFMISMVQATCSKMRISNTQRFPPRRTDSLSSTLTFFCSSVSQVCFCQPKEQLQTTSGV